MQIIAYNNYQDEIMIDIHPEHLQIVKSILNQHLSDYEIRVFGSRIKGAAKTFSDLDLVVMTDKPLSLHLLTTIDNVFSESDLPYKVDIVDWATTSEEFRTIILQQSEIIQGYK